MNLTDLLKALRRWLDGVRLPFRVLTDSPAGLWVIFETDNALAELLAGEPECAPYRFVSFTVLDTRPDMHAEPVFCFYDDDSHSIPDILAGLDQGLVCAAAR